MQKKITTFLTFDGQAEEAVAFYTSVFEGSRILSTTRHEGKLLTATFELAGQEFMRGVFALAPGETGTAPNQPHTRVYVVRVVSQVPSDEILRTMFLESGMNRQLMSVAQGETLNTVVEWYEGLEREMNLVWERPPSSQRGS